MIVHISHDHGVWGILKINTGIRILPTEINASVTIFLNYLASSVILAKKLNIIFMILERTHVKFWKNFENSSFEQWRFSLQ